MARAPKDEEQKTERFNMFMSPSEMEAIDAWAWENKIRSKSEAVRRLCQMALSIENSQEQFREISENTQAAIMAAVEHYNAFFDELEVGPDGEPRNLTPVEERLVDFTMAMGRSFGEGFKTLVDTIRLSGYFRHDHELETIISDYEKAQARFAARRARMAGRESKK